MPLNDPSGSSSSSSSSSPEEWIYHERQDALLCGQHALNNLVQAQVFSPDMLADIAHQLDALETTMYQESNEKGVLSKDFLRHASSPSHNVDESGNFSVQVLRAALQQLYQLELTHLRSAAATEATSGTSDHGTAQDICDYQGFICHNHSSQHWFAVRKVGGRFWNLDSTLERPVAVSHFRVATEFLDAHRTCDQVFAVTGGPLPPPADAPHLRQQQPERWWNLRDLLEGKAAANNNSNNNNKSSDDDDNHRKTKAASWEHVGTGMRLDGKKPRREQQQQQQALSEDEQLRLALAASMLPTVTPEPPKGTPNTSMIQFRLPNGGASSRQSQQRRRFHNDDPVAMIYAYVQEMNSDTATATAAAAATTTVELRYGYPPKDLEALQNMTIGEAKLNGECIQGRFVG